MVKFLKRDVEEISFGDCCLEMPTIACLGSTKLYSEKLTGLSPPTLSLNTLVEDLGFSEDYTKYMKQSGDKNIRKV